MMMTGTVGSIALDPASGRSSPSPLFMRRSVTTTSAGCRGERAPAPRRRCRRSRRRSPPPPDRWRRSRAMSTTSSTTSTRSLPAAAVMPAPRRCGDRRPQHGRGRPRARRAGEIDLAAVVAHDAGRDRQPQPGPLAARLGREERIEHRLQVLGRDARALVDDLGCGPSRRRARAGVAAGCARPAARRRTR